MKHKKAYIPLSYRPDVIEKNCPSKNPLLKERSIKISDIFLISGKEDTVLDDFACEMQNKNTFFYRLYYDELGSRWNFSFFNGLLKIETKEGEKIPKAIYHRHPGISITHEYYHLHTAFLEAVDLWKGTVVGERRDHYHNTSKMYQAITSLRVACEKNHSKIVKIPCSYFVKGSKDELKKTTKKLVVKSCSNARSICATEKDAEKWDEANLFNLPTLFQEKIEGKNIRVHFCNQVTWIIEISNHTGVDYRFSHEKNNIYNNGSLPEELHTFCSLISDIEGNKLIGVDFIQSEGRYFCLESNPGPAWSKFEHPSKTDFAEVIMSALTIPVPLQSHPKGPH